ncbi:hypothetical protein NDU88_010567 [Pleurodeles waltl]|uniref:Uncharacterized protein n=1 Tax=Pleurodeles waltl TaxID=8319 RepID=A0AAV7S2A1_PLEWA|nr:hypothetical protein NDU88_010567 [Pleurodeles waltl]
MQVDVKNSLHNINAKIDLLTIRINHIKERVDKHDNHLQYLETHTSYVADTQITSGEHLLRLEKIVEVIKQKRGATIFASPKYLNPLSLTKLGKDYVEHMLWALFEDALLAIFMWNALTASLLP